MVNETELGASEGLELVARTRRAAAARMIPPRWYHPAVGVAMGLIVGNAGRQGSQLLGGLGLMLLLFAIFAFQKRAGAWPSMSYKGSPLTHRLMGVLLALVIATIAVAAWLDYVEGYPHALMWGGIASGLLSIILGYVWEVCFRMDEGLDQ